MRECYLVYESHSDDDFDWEINLGVTLTMEKAKELRDKSKREHSQEMLIPYHIWDNLTLSALEVAKRDGFNISSFAEVINKYIETDYTLEELQRSENCYELEPFYKDTHIETLHLYE